MTDKQIAHHVLDILAACEGYMLPEVTLFAHLNLLLPAPDKLTKQDFKRHLNFARAERWVECQADTFGEKKWWVTDAGKVELQR